jgi:hypothetical protein
MNTDTVLPTIRIFTIALALIALPASADDSSDGDEEVVVEAGVVVAAGGVGASVVVASEAPVEPHACDEVAVECDAPRKRTYLGDANSGWFHVGGGVGAIAPSTPHGKLPSGRFILGGGGYTFGLYLGGGMELSGTQVVPFELQGVGSIGVHIPIPVVHPMFGFKAGAGLAALPRGVDPYFEIDVGMPHLDHKPIPSFMVGCQMGVMIREFDGNVGVRVMIEPAVHYYPQIGVKAREVFITAAFVM